MIVRDYERDSAMSKMIGSVHTTSEEFENGFSFLYYHHCVLEWDQKITVIFFFCLLQSTLLFTSAV